MKKKILIAATLFLAGTALTAALPLNRDGKSSDTIELSQCIPLSDVAEVQIEDDGYYHITLKDVGNQLDDPENISYSQLFENLETEG